MAGGLRASGPKADLALVVADGDAAAAGVFTTNIVCAAPVTFCRNVLAERETVRAVRPALVPCEDSQDINACTRKHSALKQRTLLCATARNSLILHLTAPDHCGVSQFLQSSVTGVLINQYGTHGSTLCPMWGSCPSPAPMHATVDARPSTGTDHVSCLGCWAQVLVNAGQANAATGDAGYEDCVVSAGELAKALGISEKEVCSPPTHQRVEDGERAQMHVSMLQILSGGPAGLHAWDQGKDST